MASAVPNEVPVMEEGSPAPFPIFSSLGHVILCESSDLHNQLFGGLMEFWQEGRKEPFINAFVLRCH